MGKILVPLDGSPGLPGPSRVAAAKIVEMAKCDRAALTIVRIVRPRVMSGRIDRTNVSFRNPGLTVGIAS
jgi:hypothetical protein